MLFAVFTVNSNAQINFSPEVGVNVSDYVINNGYTDLAPAARNSIRAGVVLEAKLGSKLTLQPGIQYTGNGFEYRYPVYGATSNVRETIGTLNVPVYVAYHVGPTTASWHFFAGAGGYYAVHISGTKTTWINGGPVTETGLRIGIDEYSDIKRSDVGAGVNAGIRHRKGFFTRLGYQHGIINLAPRPAPGEKMYSFSWALTVGYFFATSGGNHAKAHAHH